VHSKQHGIACLPSTFHFQVSYIAVNTNFYIKDKKEPEIYELPGYTGLDCQSENILAVKVGYLWSVCGGVSVRNLCLVRSTEDEVPIRACGDAYVSEQLCAVCGCCYNRRVKPSCYHPLGKSITRPYSPGRKSELHMIQPIGMCETRQSSAIDKLFAIATVIQRGPGLISDVNDKVASIARFTVSRSSSLLRQYFITTLR
jgi:hypothetical protein